MTDENECIDGGLAFPMGYHPEGNSEDHQGMSRRDYLAAHAPRHVCAKIMCRFTDFTDYQTAYARAAHIYADAMIAQS